jgi:uncharacterized protein (DUF885 family)
VRGAAASLATALCFAGGAFAQTNAAAQLARLAEETYQAHLDLDPIIETYRHGPGPRQDQIALEFTRAHREKARAVHRRTLARADAIPRDGLDETQAITRQLLAYHARRELEELELPIEEHALLGHSWGGLANQFLRWPTIQPLRNEADYRAWFTRLRRASDACPEARVVLEEARRRGIITPAVLVRLALDQWGSLVPADGDVKKSALWKPMAQVPASIPAEARANLEAEYRALLVDEVFPKMRAFVAYARETYLPSARTTDGIAAIPGGAAMYRFLVRKHTTTELTPDQIHELGLKEVARIQRQLVLVASQVGFKGEMKDFGGWIESRPENYPFRTAEEVLAYLRQVHETRVVPQLPKLFSRLPKAAFEIQATEPELAATANATYQRPTSDGSRPGIFRIPLPDPRKRALYGLRSLLAHEGMPGHHFDNGIAMELDVPEFRKAFRTVAFGEGWGLYAESLGHEMGLYDEPLSLMGRYAAELFRAARLVVDTGLHAKGWTRERAIRYMIEEAGSAEPGATNEIHRYMMNPGQALGYKVGELAILELRSTAERRLGPRFDIRAFHDALLAQGHLPLSMLKERMMRWIEAVAA